MSEKQCKQCGFASSEDALFCPQCGNSFKVKATVSPAPPSDPLLGSVVADRYLLVEQIGHGGSGTIYRGEHTTLRKKVAVKLLHANLSGDEGALERFRREATTVGEIDNEHILQVMDFGRITDGRLFFVMELLDGEPLSRVLERERRLSIDRAVDILTQAGEALMEAHALGYVHRDLRPRNMFLITKRGRKDFVKLLDFGLAKLVLPEHDAGRTSMGMTFGDPRYMSPEQARGDTVDRRGDLYSLGVIAYEMLCGMAPYDGPSPAVVLERVLSSEIPSVRKVRPDCPEWLDKIVYRTMAKRADDRFVTVLRMLECLKEKMVPPPPEPAVLVTEPAAVPARVVAAAAAAASAVDNRPTVQSIQTVPEPRPVAATATKPAVSAAATMKPSNGTAAVAPPPAQPQPQPARVEPKKPDDKSGRQLDDRRGKKPQKPEKTKPKTPMASPTAPARKEEAQQAPVIKATMAMPTLITPAAAPLTAKTIVSPKAGVDDATLLGKAATVASSIVSATAASSASSTAPTLVETAAPPPPVIVVEAQSTKKPDGRPHKQVANEDISGPRARASQSGEHEQLWFDGEPPAAAVGSEFDDIDAPPAKKNVGLYVGLSVAAATGVLLLLIAVWPRAQKQEHVPKRDVNAPAMSTAIKPATEAKPTPTTPAPTTPTPSVVAPTPPAVTATPTPPPVTAVTPTPPVALVATKPVEPAPAPVATRPAETKPAAPVAVKPAETRPVETKPAETKPAEKEKPAPVAAKPAETKPAPAPAKPAEKEKTASKPVESKPEKTAAKPAEKTAAKPAEKPAEKTASKPETTGKKTPEGWRDAFNEPGNQAVQAEFYVKNGKSKLNAGDYSGAVSQFNKAREFDSKNADAIAGLGECSFEQGDFGNAAVHLKQAIRLAPRRTKYGLLLGQAYYKLGKFKDAVAEYKKVLKIDPKNQEAQESLHLAESRLGG